MLERAEQILGIGSWECDVGTGRLVCSDNVFRLFGFEPGAVVPSLELLVERVYPRDQASAERMLALARRDGELRPTEVRIVRTDGAVRRLRVISGDDASGARRSGRLSGAIHDITEEQRADRGAAGRLTMTALPTANNAPPDTTGLALTSRERQIIQLAADGLNGRQIADRLVLSPATIKTHFANIYAKLGASDRASAVAQALRRQLIR